MRARFGFFSIAWSLHVVALLNESELEGLSAPLLLLLSARLLLLSARLLVPSKLLHELATSRLMPLSASRLIELPSEALLPLLSLRIVLVFVSLLRLPLLSFLADSLLFFFPFLPAERSEHAVSGRSC